MSAIAIPALQGRLWIDGSAVDVNLEVKVAADGAGVAGLAHEADGLAGPDTFAAVDQGWFWHVGVEVGAVLVFAVDQ
jgi:hypothetical protein